MSPASDASVSTGDAARQIPFTVARVPVSRIMALRQAVLGAPGAKGPFDLPGDDEPTTIALAALDVEGEVLAVARLSLEEPPFPVDELIPPGTPAHRLRGMATRPDARNQGIGSAVLGAAVAQVAERGGGLVWCNARIPALGLYRRAGFGPYGEAWVHPEGGPHIVMWRQVSAAQPLSN